MVKLKKLQKKLNVSNSLNLKTDCLKVDLFF
jgi:hypothetical protein